MKKKKPKHGGARTGAGRKELPDGKARVNFSTTIAPETDKNIRKQAAALKTSIGKYLDIIHGVKK